MEHSVIVNNQSGFTPGDSTMNQLLKLTQTLYKSLDVGKGTVAVFIDFTKAFNKVWHEGLFMKIRLVGICGTLYNWLMHEYSQSSSLYYR